MSTLLKEFAVCALLLVGGQVLAANTGNDGGGEGPVTRSAPAPHILHPGK